MNQKKRDIDKQINEQKQLIKAQNGLLTQEVYGHQIKRSIIGDKYEEVDMVDALDWRQPGGGSSSSSDCDDVDVSETEPSMDPQTALHITEKNNDQSKYD